MDSRENNAETECEQLERQVRDLQAKCEERTELFFAEVKEKSLWKGEAARLKQELEVAKKEIEVLKARLASFEEEKEGDAQRIALGGNAPVGLGSDDIHAGMDDCRSITEPAANTPASLPPPSHDISANNSQPTLTGDLAPLNVTSPNTLFNASLASSSAPPIALTPAASSSSAGPSTSNAIISLKRQGEDLPDQQVKKVKAEEWQRPFDHLEMWANIAEGGSKLKFMPVWRDDETREDFLQRYEELDGLLWPGGDRNVIPTADMARTLASVAHNGKGPIMAEASYLWLVWVMDYAFSNKWPAEVFKEFADRESKRRGSLQTTLSREAQAKSKKKKN